MKEEVLPVWRWIASRSLSSGAHSRDPLARNDGESLSVNFAATIAAPHRASRGRGLFRSTRAGDFIDASKPSGVQHGTRIASASRHATRSSRVAEKATVMTN